MNLNRAQRRQMKRKAPTLAAIMAAWCFDYLKDGAKPLAHPLAVAAHTRAFRLLIEVGGKPVVLPLYEAEALGFSERKADHLPGGVTWLAVGLDVQGRETYTLHTALSQIHPTAHQAARNLALARLTEVCAFAGFPPTRQGIQLLMSISCKHCRRARETPYCPAPYTKPVKASLLPIRSRSVYDSVLREFREPLASLT